MAMSNVLKRRRGTYEEHITFVGEPGEITIVTDRETQSENGITYRVPMWELRVHDGSTPGGYRISTYNEMINYVTNRKIELSNMNEDLYNKFMQIDDMLKETDADKKYRHSDTDIVMKDLGLDVIARLDSIANMNDTLRYDLSLSDELHGSNLVGYLADINAYGPSASTINTVKKALDNLGERATYNLNLIESNTSTLSNMAVNIKVAQQLVESFNVQLDDLTLRVNDAEPKIETNRQAIEVINNDIVNIEARANQYTDLEIIQVNDSIDKINTEIDELTEDVYKKSEIDEFNLLFTNKDSELTETLDNTIDRVSVLEETRYTKTETDALISNSVANVVNSAPEALDTLKELADALGNDNNFATNVTNQISSKADLDEFNRIKEIVEGDDGVTGLVGDVNTLEAGLNSSNGRIESLENYVNGYDEVPGLMTRMATVEMQLGLGGQENTIEGINTRLDALEALISRHANELNQLENVAFTGRYDDLIGSPIIPKGYYTGSNTFNSKDGRRIAVPHSYQSEGNTYSVLISPKSNPLGTIGEVWITKYASEFYVFCSGETRTTSFDYVIFNNDGHSSGGES